MAFKTMTAFAAALTLAPVAVPMHPVLAASFSEEAPFNQAAFDAAQKAGKPILVHITAPWCSTCAAQKPIIDKLRAEARFKPFVVFNVDFDSQKKLLRRFGAQAQSTLIVYKGTREEGRSTGETAPGAIGALLGRAI